MSTDRVTNTDARAHAIETIAGAMLWLETLEPRGSDRLDFHELAVWDIKAALERAFEAGRSAATPHRITCPACGRDIETRPM